MEGGLPDRERRAVLVRTVRGSIEGYLHVNPAVRTLDHLNLAHRFITVEPTDFAVRNWSFERSPLGVNLDSIVFIAEFDEDVPPSDHHVVAVHFTREAAALRVGDCEVRGFLHVRGIHDPVTLLNQYRHPFVALTAASVVGPGFELASAFVAVNPAHVLTVQSIAQDAAEAPAPSVTTSDRKAEDAVEDPGRVF